MRIQHSVIFSTKTVQGPVQNTDVNFDFHPSDFLSFNKLMAVGLVGMRVKRGQLESNAVYQLKFTRKGRIYHSHLTRLS